MAHFYLDETLELVAPGELVSISGEEARHAVTVARLKEGERTTLGNGRGLILSGTVKAVSPSSFKVEIESANQASIPTPRIFLAQALAKGGRDEMAIQSATELGVDGIIPWAAERSISKWPQDKRSRQLDRWGSILREASKQSIRPFLPELKPMATTASLCELSEGFRLVVLDPDAELAISKLDTTNADLLLVVGPEGGISQNEKSEFASSGAEFVSLGTNVLRTSTAGPAAISALNLLLGRW